MRKCLIFTLAAVLLFGATALAGEVQVGGEVRYVLTIPADDLDWYQKIQYRLKVTGTVNETTDAMFLLRSRPDADGPVVEETFDELLYAELNTKLAGLGTLRLGRVENGTSPFASFGDVWGAGDGGDGLAFATESFGGLAADIFIGPEKDNTTVSGEVTYALPVIEGSSVGLAFKKVGDADADLAAIANVPLGEALTLYGELGSTGASDEMDIQNVGAKLSAGGATFYAEAAIEPEKYYLQATVPVQGVSLNASYQFGDGYTTAGDDGKLTFWARVAF